MNKRETVNGQGAAGKSFSIEDAIAYLAQSVAEIAAVDDAAERDMRAAQIQAELKARGLNVTLPIIKKQIKDVRRAAEEKRSSERDSDDYADYGRYTLAMKPDGLWRETVFKDDKAIYNHIAPHFDFVGRCYDSTGGGWGAVLRFNDPRQNPVELILKGSEIHGPANKLAGRLHESGLCFQPLYADVVAAYIAGQENGALVATVSATGWHTIGGRKLFALPQEIIGSTSADPMRFIGSNQIYSSNGTLDQWKAAVAAPAGQHRLLALSLAVALAGPLLHLLNAESGGIHYLVGRFSEFE